MKRPRHLMLGSPDSMFWGGRRCVHVSSRTHQPISDIMSRNTKVSASSNVDVRSNKEDLPTNHNEIYFSHQTKEISLKDLTHSSTVRTLDRLHRAPSYSQRLSAWPTLGAISWNDQGKVLDVSCTLSGRLQNVQRSTEVSHRDPRLLRSHV